MKLRVIWIGKTKEPHLAALATDFTTRIKRFLPIEITELKESRIEADKILGALDSSDRVVVLDDKGVSWTSAQLATFVGKHMNGSAPVAYHWRPYGPRRVRKNAPSRHCLFPADVHHDMPGFAARTDLLRANHHSQSSVPEVALVSGL
jgi:hypothetical protein